MNFQSKANKNVCPNDRELSLRAEPTRRLQMGWTAARSEPPLSKSEREAIATVVKRAEEFDELDARRVGRLVKLLERLRTCPVPGSCLLCSDMPKILGPFRTCSICKNSACRKCVSETIPHRSSIFSREQYICNLCSETREVWKKSGAWFFKFTPKKYILQDKK